MKTKAFFSVLFFLLFAHSASFAQKAADNEEVKEKVNTVVEKFDQALKLEKAKRNTIEDIFNDFYTGQQKLKDHIQGPASSLRQGFAKQSFQSVRKQNEALITERENRLKKELTEEQYKKWKGEIEPSLHSSKRK